MTTLVNDEIIRVFEPRLKTCFFEHYCLTVFYMQLFLKSSNSKIVYVGKLLIKMFICNCNRKMADAAMENTDDSGFSITP